MRSTILAAVLVLALSAPASAQDAPDSLWESAQGGTGSESVDEGGRSAFLFGLALLAFTAAGALVVLAVRTPRQPRRPRPRPQPAAAPPVEVPAEPPRARRPRPVAGPPPLPAFGPGSHAARLRSPAASGLSALMH